MEVEKWWLKSGVTWDWDWDYNKQKQFLGQYKTQYACIAGWWRSYHGLFPIAQWFPVCHNHPFHHPWMMLSSKEDFETGECYGEWPAQMKVVPRSWGNSWHAVGMVQEREQEPDYPIPDLMDNLPHKPVPTITPSKELPDPRIKHAFAWDTLSPQAQAILSLPMHTLAGIADRRSVNGILGFCRHIADFATRYEHETIWNAIVHYKLVNIERYRGQGKPEFVAWEPAKLSLTETLDALYEEGDF
jgi:hypothetical protein